MLVSDEDFSAIIARLRARTLSGSLTWGPWQDDDPDELMADSPRFTYYVAKNAGGRTGAYRLQVWSAGEDGKGVQVAELQRIGSQSLREDLEELYDAALEAALSASSLKDDILSDLE